MGYIYKITNKINQKAYIGQTAISIHDRFKKHIYCSFNHIMRHGKDEYNYPIHAAIRKYGEENFIVEQIEECDNADLSEREQYWIAFYNTYKSGYNATKGGDGNLRYNYDEIVEYFLNNGYSITETCKHFSIYDQVVYSALKSKNIDYKQYNTKFITAHKNKNIVCVEEKLIFKTMKDIDIWLGKQAHPNIRRCLNGITKKAYGYSWLEISEEEAEEYARKYDMAFF